MKAFAVRLLLTEVFLNFFLLFRMKSLAFLSIKKPPVFTLRGEWPLFCESVSFKLCILLSAAGSSASPAESNCHSSSNHISGVNTALQITVSLPFADV